MPQNAELDIDFEAWETHAKWWDAEGRRVRKQYAVDDATLHHAGNMYGRIGASDIGPATQEALRARAETGEFLGQYCDSIAAHIRHNLRQYRQTEEANQHALRT